MEITKNRTDNHRSNFSVRICFQQRFYDVHAGLHGPSGNHHFRDKNLFFLKPLPHRIQPCNECMVDDFAGVCLIAHRFFCKRHRIFQLSGYHRIFQFFKVRFHRFFADWSSF